MGNGCSLKYAWSMASIALIRLRQSSFIKSLISDSPVGESSRNLDAMLPWLVANWRIGSAPGRSFHPGIFWSLGDPINSKMIWA